MIQIKKTKKPTKIDIGKFFSLKGSYQDHGFKKIIKKYLLEFLHYSLKRHRQSKPLM